MNNKRLAVITITSIAILLTFSTIYSNLEIIEAYAGVTLNHDNVAKTIIVRVNPTGTNFENSFDSFSRIGFVQGEANFLLESVPSKDKKPFYTLVQKSLESKNTLLKNKGMNISIDVYSGDGEVIETLVYSDCDVVEYFVHGVDSKGKIFFTEEDGTVEIREVTKFECVSFALDITLLQSDLERIEETIELISNANPFELDTEEGYFSRPATNGTEGELFYNSMTNKLQRFVDGQWVDISGVGGPASPRR
ncbi:hypothetical protein [Nitrosopumilus sp.]|uniref:hypothetical protein n=1 Tax=Nitrosopumilus sp. TaxID=2024843 RepID=UPI00247C557A|nr:hypothetical protein [Nitrosopumilus sp.]MCV0431541.1 hypothetical protein [Nitrosopumilus sp.]